MKTLWPCGIASAAMPSNLPNIVRPKCWSTPSIIMGFCDQMLIGPQLPEQGGMDLTTSKLRLRHCLPIREIARPTGLPRKQRWSLKRMQADLVALGFAGSYNRVAAFTREWRADRRRENQATGLVEALVQLIATASAPREKYPSAKGYTHFYSCPRGALSSRYFLPRPSVQY